MSRGDRSEPIFKDDDDRKVFLKTLGEACGKTGWDVHAFCLMDNHFHMVVETPAANLVAGMKWFLGTYTGRFNRRHKIFRHLFSGRYKALVVDGSGNGYFKTVCDYVHLNPVRAGLVRKKLPLRAYRWSSWPEYLDETARRWKWLRVDRLLGEHGIPKDSPAGRRQLEASLEERRAGEGELDYGNLRRGRCFGGDEFKKELAERVRAGMGPEHFGAERREGAEALAEGIVEQEIARRGWGSGELDRRAKGDKDKLAIAERLRPETTVPVSWIAERLEMGTRGYLHHLLHRRRKTSGKGYAKTKNPP